MSARLVGIVTGFPSSGNLSSLSILVMFLLIAKFYVYLWAHVWAYCMYISKIKNKIKALTGCEVSP